MVIYLNSDWGYGYLFKIVIGVMVIYLNSDLCYGYFIKIVDLFCIKKVLKKNKEA